METTEHNVESYVTSDGRAPFEEWLDKLKDVQARARIKVRVDRMRTGNFGSWQSLKGGLFEMKIHYGQGYRVYFGRVGSNVVLLLCGGDKSSQRRDIAQATTYWKEYSSKNYEKKRELSILSN